MTEVGFTPGGIPETVLEPEPDEAVDALRAALAGPVEGRRDAVSDVCARWPRFLDAWARLAQLARDDVEAYAYCRVGYHRGLDRLRQSGWRGLGLCPLEPRDEPRLPAWRSRACGRRPSRSVRPTRPAAATSSSTSSTPAGTGVPTSPTGPSSFVASTAGEKRETRTHHRYHRPGRPAPFGVPFRQGLPGLRPRARTGESQDRDGPETRTPRSS